LGVDLVPFKTYTYDCVYCQLGRTTCQTTARREYVPVADVVAELRRRLREDPGADYVTLSGSGEPTLHSRIGEVVAAIKETTHIPVAVLTNGALLGNTDVQDALAQADVVLPSLDAGDPQVFEYVNRPHRDIRFEAMAEGLVEFRRRCRTPMWLEVFLLEGVTGLEAEVHKIARWVERIMPERVQLNTVARPPAEECALPVPRDVLERLASLFEPCAEVIADFCPSTARFTGAVSQKDVLDLLSRRPCTVRDVAHGLGIHVAEAAKRLEALSASGVVTGIRRSRRCYYTVTTRTRQDADR
jgi:wyosine [tRNA(Phe)-imidazoG37] synthetase (radical SAM superfamily)